GGGGGGGGSLPTPTTPVVIPNVTGSYSPTGAADYSSNINGDKSIATPSDLIPYCTSGTLIKGSTSAVYYCGANGKRYVFPNAAIFKSWYNDFSGVITLSDVALGGITIGGNVTYRPGKRMVKIQSDPKVYAIAKGGLLRPIADEATARALYGANWNKMIDDVSDAFFVNYTMGVPISLSDVVSP
ncbi:MAG: hypothetical protein WCJ29_04450, partial [bacterium]